MADFTLERPHPPPALFEIDGLPFSPDASAVEWIRSTFLSEESPLYNSSHDHLRNADIGVLWTSVPNAKNMIQIAAQAEKPFFQGNKWSKARQAQQMTSWFGFMPDFVITVSADYARECDDASWCALIEHELYHCAQDRDEFGIPKFNQQGRPLFAIQGHDVEEFVGVVRRYGSGSAAGQTQALVDAANAKPLIARADITKCCGTCAL